MAIVGKAIMAILTINSIMATLAPILNDHKYELCGCLKKEWPKCRSPVKTVMKKMDPMKSYEQNKKKLIKMVILGKILCKIGHSKKGVAHMENKV